jgi:hypothetical protein
MEDHCNPARSLVRLIQKTGVLMAAAGHTDFLDKEDVRHGTRIPSNPGARDYQPGMELSALGNIDFGIQPAQDNCLADMEENIHAFAWFQSLN